MTDWIVGMYVDPDPGYSRFYVVPWKVYDTIERGAKESGISQELFDEWFDVKWFREVDHADFVGTDMEFFDQYTDPDAVWPEHNPKWQLVEYDKSQPDKVQGNVTFVGVVGMAG